jgi:hypothetical protein
VPPNFDVAIFRDTITNEEVRAPGFLLFRQYGTGKSAPSALIVSETIRNLQPIASVSAIDGQFVSSFFIFLRYRLNQNEGRSGPSALDLWQGLVLVACALALVDTGAAFPWRASGSNEDCGD